jgi:hypothetical protein
MSVYRYLNEFDSAMNNTEEQFRWLSAPQVGFLTFGRMFVSSA